MSFEIPQIDASSGAADILSDVHGQAQGLLTLMERLGWQIDPFSQSDATPVRAHHPDNRMLIFTGDLVNKGPEDILVLRLVMNLVRGGQAHVVMGNHEAMLLEALLNHKRVPARARPAQALARKIKDHGLDFEARVIAFLSGLPTQIRIHLDPDHPLYGDGAITVTHAACPARHIDQTTPKARQRNIWGFSRSEERRRPAARRGWARRYDGPRWIIHGHVPAPGPRITGRTICLDCGAGNNMSLAALRLDTCDFLLQPVALIAAQKTPIMRRAA